MNLRATMVKVLAATPRQDGFEPGHQPVPLVIRDEALPILALLLVKAFLITLAVHSGFQAVSDDDYSRVVIAQLFAVTPKLDPSGTSWLPFPFWLLGGIMMAVGRSLESARLASWAIACGSAALVYLAARRSGLRPHVALLGTMVGTSVPLGILSSTATIPEFYTASLCTAALLSLRRGRPSDVWVAGVFILPATLSRYETWPIAMVVAVYGAWRLSREGVKHAALPAFAGLVAASLGPVLWMAWNWTTHGSPLAFHKRVADYWFALGRGTEGTLVDLITYPRALATSEPLLLLGVMAVVGLYAKRGLVAGKLLETWSLPLIGVVWVMLWLTGAQLTGGAPTHHPERALLFVSMIGWIWVTASIDTALRSWKRGLPLVSSLLVAVFAYRIAHTAAAEDADRTDALATGHWLRENAVDGLVLLVPTDYGHFAVSGSLAEPERVVLSDDLDPRNRQVVRTDQRGYCKLAHQHKAEWLVTSGPPFDGQASFVRGAWRIGRVAAICPETTSGQRERHD